MTEFLTVLSKIIYVFFIISSVLFGLSVAIRIYVMNTAKKIVKESNKNFGKIGDLEMISKCNSVVEEHICRYVSFSESAKLKAKAERRNKVKKFLKLKQKKVEDDKDSLKDISLSLFREISNCFEGSGGYLNYSKNEIISMLKKLTLRLNAIFVSSDVIWLKTLKISSIARLITFTKNIEKFKGKTPVIILSYALEFAFSVSRILSPVSASKLLADNLVSSSFNSLLVSSVFTIVGKEWAVLCYEKQQSRLARLSGKKVA